MVGSRAGQALNAQAHSFHFPSQGLSEVSEETVWGGDFVGDRWVVFAGYARWMLSVLWTVGIPGGKAQERMEHVVGRAEAQEAARARAVVRRQEKHGANG
ncbi:hypothetical protein Shyhy02_73300 [Streptomyces hygroscopicus subsp. hygroscopicus]|nr:hypothetical protein Shyhy02_73300 [Streptomyces hygroscopicus subsp. hygroscopicus]